MNLKVFDQLTQDNRDPLFLPNSLLISIYKDNILKVDAISVNMEIALILQHQFESKIKSFFAAPKFSSVIVLVDKEVYHFNYKKNLIKKIFSEVTQLIPHQPENDLVKIKIESEGSNSLENSPFYFDYNTAVNNIFVKQVTGSKQLGFCFFILQNEVIQQVNVECGDNINLTPVFSNDGFTISYLEPFFAEKPSDTDLSFQISDLVSNLHIKHVKMINIRQIGHFLLINTENKILYKINLAKLVLTNLARRYEKMPEISDLTSFIDSQLKNTVFFPKGPKLLSEANFNIKKILKFRKHENISFDLSSPADIHQLLALKIKHNSVEDCLKLINFDNFFDVSEPYHSVQVRSEFIFAALPVLLNYDKSNDISTGNAKLSQKGDILTFSQFEIEFNIPLPAIAKFYKIPGTSTVNFLVKTDEFYTVNIKKGSVEDLIETGINNFRQGNFQPVAETFLFCSTLSPVSVIFLFTSQLQFSDFRMKNQIEIENLPPKLLLSIIPQCENFQSIFDSFQIEDSFKRVLTTVNNPQQLIFWLTFYLKNCLKSELSTLPSHNSTVKISPLEHNFAQAFLSICLTSSYFNLPEIDLPISKFDYFYAFSRFILGSKSSQNTPSELLFLSLSDKKKLSEKLAKATNFDENFFYYLGQILDSNPRDFEKILMQKCEFLVGENIVVKTLVEGKIESLGSGCECSGIFNVWVFDLVMRKCEVGKELLLKMLVLAAQCSSEEYQEIDFTVKNRMSWKSMECVEFLYEYITIYNNDNEEELECYKSILDCLKCNDLFIDVSLMLAMKIGDGNTFFELLFDQFDGQINVKNFEKIVQKTLEINKKLSKALSQQYKCTIEQIQAFDNISFSSSIQPLSSRRSLACLLLLLTFRMQQFDDFHSYASRLINGPETAQQLVYVAEKVIEILAVSGMNFKFISGFLMQFREFQSLNGQNLTIKLKSIDNELVQCKNSLITTQNESVVVNAFSKCAQCKGLIGYKKVATRSGAQKFEVICEDCFPK